MIDVDEQLHPSEDPLRCHDETAPGTLELWPKFCLLSLH